MPYSIVYHPKHLSSNIIYHALNFSYYCQWWKSLRITKLKYLQNSFWMKILSIYFNIFTKIRMMHVSHATVRTNFSSTRSSVSLTSWIMAHVSLCWLVGYNPFLFFFPSHASNNNKSKLTCDHVKQTFNKIIDEIYLEFLSLFLLWKNVFKTYLFEKEIFHSKK